MLHLHFPKYLQPKSFICLSVPLPFTSIFYYKNKTCPSVNSETCTSLHFQGWVIKTCVLRASRHCRKLPFSCVFELPSSTWPHETCSGDNSSHRENLVRPSSTSGQAYIHIKFPVSTRLGEDYTDFRDLAAHVIPSSPPQAAPEL